MGNDITSGPLAGTREALYGNATITNQAGGLIRGDSDSGIFVGGPASGFTVTIDNQAGATIRGGGATTAAIQTGAHNDTVINAGQIIADSSGKAIDLGAGSNLLRIVGGAASIVGYVSGGAGSTSSLVIDPGAGNTFNYSGAFSNFSSAEIKSGAVRLFGASTYSGATTVSGGTLFAQNSSGSATGSGAVTVKNLATFGGGGRVDGNVSIESGGRISPGASAGVLTLNGNLNLVDASRFLFDLGSSAATSDLITIGGALVFTGAGAAVFDFANNGAGPGTYTLLNFGSMSGVDLSRFAIGTHDGFIGAFVLGSNSLSLVVTPVPEPSTTGIIAGLLVFVGAIARRKAQASARARRNCPR